MVALERIPKPYTVTLAARTCPAYADIIANRNRNNIQESLEDLGPDTNYCGRRGRQPRQGGCGTPGQLLAADRLELPVGHWHHRQVTSHREPVDGHG